MGGGDMALAGVRDQPDDLGRDAQRLHDGADGDPAKDAPYYPSLAPGGKLPPLP